MGKGHVQGQHVVRRIAAAVTKAVAIAESCRYWDFGKIGAIQIRQVQGLGMGLYLEAERCDWCLALSVQETVCSAYLPTDARMVLLCTCISALESSMAPLLQIIH